MIYVFQLKNPEFMDYLKLDLSKVYSRKYDLVAEVQTQELEDAFRLTNSIDTPWEHNPLTKAYKKNSRSSSVSDIFVKVDDQGFPISFHGVASSGFETLDFDRMKKNLYHKIPEFRIRVDNAVQYLEKVSE